MRLCTSPDHLLPWNERTRSLLNSFPSLPFSPFSCRSSLVLSLLSCLSYLASLDSLPSSVSYVPHSPFSLCLLSVSIPSCVRLPSYRSPVYFLPVLDIKFSGIPSFLLSSFIFFPLSYFSTFLSYSLILFSVQFFLFSFHLLSLFIHFFLSLILFYHPFSFSLSCPSLTASSAPCFSPFLHWVIPTAFIG